MNSSHCSVNTSKADVAARSLEAILSPYSVINAEKPPVLSEDQVRPISDALDKIGKESWGRVPRLYATLHMVKSVPVIDSFISTGISDLWFPFSHKTLPESLRNPSARHDFLDRQEFVLTKALDLEREDGSHRHFRNPDDIPLRKLEELGKGGYGYVDHVVSTITYKEYARKLIPRGKTFRKNKEVLRDFERELGHLKKLSHLHIVKLVGSYTDPRFVGILMAPVAESNLKDFLDRRPLSSGDRSFLRTFYGCLASALCYLHEQKVRHKDIKPQNVLVKGHQVYLTDFGISLDWSDYGQSTTTGITSRTQRYCAPEVGHYQPRNSLADLWSLGCVYLEIWTVLKGELILNLFEYLKSHGSESSCYYLNYKSAVKWCEALRTHRTTRDENPALPWISGCLEPDQDKRWSAQVLVDAIAESIENSEHGSSFCGICCIEQDDSTASHSSSKRSSACLDDTGVSSIGVYVPKSLKARSLERIDPMKDSQSSVTTITQSSSETLKLPPESAISLEEVENKEGHTNSLPIIKGATDEIDDSRVIEASKLSAPPAHIVTAANGIDSQASPTNSKAGETATDNNTSKRVNDSTHKIADMDVSSAFNPFAKTGGQARYILSRVSNKIGKSTSTTNKSISSAELQLESKSTTNDITPHFVEHGSNPEGYAGGKDLSSYTNSADRKGCERSLTPVEPPYSRSDSSVHAEAYDQTSIHVSTSCTVPTSAEVAPTPHGSDRSPNDSMQSESPDIEPFQLEAIEDTDGEQPQSDQPQSIPASSISSGQLHQSRSNRDTLEAPDTMYRATKSSDNTTVQLDNPDPTQDFKQERGSFDAISVRTPFPQGKELSRAASTPPTFDNSEHLRASAANSSASAHVVVTESSSISEHVLLGEDQGDSPREQDPSEKKIDSILIKALLPWYKHSGDGDVVIKQDVPSVCQQISQILSDIVNDAEQNQVTASQTEDLGPERIFTTASRLALKQEFHDNGTGFRTRLSKVISGRIKEIQNFSGHRPIKAVTSIEESNTETNTCYTCRKSINNDYIQATVIRKSFHSECFHCEDCGKDLDDERYFPTGGAFRSPPDDRDFMILCAEDYSRRLKLTCHACSLPLQDQYKVSTYCKYHEEHCHCSICGLRFGDTDLYFEEAGKLFCELDYRKDVATVCSGCNAAITDIGVQDRSIDRTERGKEMFHQQCYLVDKIWRVRIASVRPQIINLVVETGDGVRAVPEEQHQDLVAAFSDIWLGLSKYEVTTATIMIELFQQWMDCDVASAMDSLALIINKIDNLFIHLGTVELTVEEICALESLTREICFATTLLIMNVVSRRVEEIQFQSSRAVSTIFAMLGNPVHDLVKLGLETSLRSSTAITYTSFVESINKSGQRPNLLNEQELLNFSTQQPPTCTACHESIWRPFECMGCKKEWLHCEDCSCVVYRHPTPSGERADSMNAGSPCSQCSSYLSPAYEHVPSLFRLSNMVRYIFVLAVVNLDGYSSRIEIEPVRSGEDNFRPISAAEAIRDGLPQMLPDVKRLIASYNDAKAPPLSV